VTPRLLIMRTPVVTNGVEHVFFHIPEGHKAKRLWYVPEEPAQQEVPSVQVIRPGHGQLVWLTDDAASGCPRKPPWVWAPT